MMTSDSNAELKAHLHDLQNSSEKWHRSICSDFMNLEEQAAVQNVFHPSDRAVYTGGYEGAEKKKVIFRYDSEDGFSDVVCLCAEVDMRFRKIGHSDILGALMSLQIDRHSFGDFWVADDRMYLYTSQKMSRFLIDNLTRIGSLRIELHEIEEHPVQEMQTQKIRVVVSSMRIDALSAALAHCSRAEAQQKILAKEVMLNHSPLDDPSEICHNGDTISIRKVGRFHCAESGTASRSGRLAVIFLKSTGS